ncbi:hypothetical protein [Rhodococcus aetherivorans]|uniref:hypothetical protein n=1 Tax=Rhodococcus aetherivorans TaxID=191292 RepID=UPI002949A756|nr:hypothetical protein [Rhodococcus aetherivorans]MDV6295225.1 hypothetical protein [Rhodococcus aetherivorans]
MSYNGPESLLNQPCTNELDSTREFTSQEVAKLALYLVFEDAFGAADERLVTREEAIEYMEAAAPGILRGEGLA